MTSHPSNPTPPAPFSDEGDLLALVEGTPLPPERAARLREALANDPNLAELATLLRADRDAVCSLPAVAAPIDLLDRVEAQLERDALVGLARSEADSVDSELPVSIVLPPGRVWITRRLGAALAAAAAVAIIAGGVLMMVPGKHPVIAPPVPGPVANDNHATPPANTDLARNDSGNGAAPDNAAGNRGNAEIAINSNSGARELEGPPVPEAVAEAVPTPPPGPSMEQLLAAAQEGRLMLRIRDDEKVARARLDGLNGNTRSLRVQAMNTERSPQLTAALTDALAKRRVADPGAVTPPSNPEPPALARGVDPSAKAPVPTVAKNDAPPAPVRENPPVLAPESFVATIPAAAESLESLRKAMGSLRVDWQIVPESVRVEAPTDTPSILWWTAPASEWGPRFTIPVVIQTN